MHVCTHKFHLKNYFRNEKTQYRTTHPKLGKYDCRFEISAKNYIRFNSLQIRLTNLKILKICIFLIGVLKYAHIYIYIRVFHFCKNVFFFSFRACPYSYSHEEPTVRNLEQSDNIQRSHILTTFLCIFICIITI